MVTEGIVSANNRRKKVGPAPKLVNGFYGQDIVSVSQFSRDNLEHIKMMNKYGIMPIDMVVVNLYQFEKTVAREGVTLEQAIENIDIGGPSMLRSSAKNFRDVTVIVDPADYDVVLKEMETMAGETSLKTRFRLARKVFHLTSKYDGAIAAYLEKAEV